MFSSGGRRQSDITEAHVRFEDGLTKEQRILYSGYVRDALRCIHNYYQMIHDGLPREVAERYLPRGAKKERKDE